MEEYCGECKKVTVWEEEDLSGNTVKVCSECGTCKNITSYDPQGDDQSASGVGSQLVYNDQHHTSLGGKLKVSNPRRRGKLQLIKKIKEIAGTLNLTKKCTNRCIDCGKMLIDANYTVNKRTAKVAAAIVYLDQKDSRPSLLLREFSNQVGIRVAFIAREVKLLKHRHGDKFVVKTLEPGRFLRAVVDELCYKMHISQETRAKVTDMALQLKELTTDSPHGHGQKLSAVSKSTILAYFTIVLKQVDPDQIDTKEKIEEITGYSAVSIQSKIYRLRQILLAMAKSLPSADLYPFSMENIIDYIPTIIRNKTFLMKGEEKFSICGAPRTSVTEEHTSSTLQLATYNENDNSGLSDLDSDVEQYIATDSEVKEKIANLSQIQDIPHTTTSPAKKKSKKRTHIKKCDA